MLAVADEAQLPVLTGIDALIPALAALTGKPTPDGCRMDMRKIGVLARAQAAAPIGQGSAGRQAEGGGLHHRAVFHRSTPFIQAKAHHAAPVIESKL